MSLGRTPSTGSAQALSARARQLTPQADERDCGSSRRDTRSCARCWRASRLALPLPAGAGAQRRRAERRRRRTCRRRPPPRREDRQRRRDPADRAPRRGQGGHRGRQPDRRQALRLRRRPQAVRGASAHSSIAATTAPAPSAYALYGGRFLRARSTPSSFMTWGERGKGNWITVYANPGHAYVVIAGLRFDTSTGGRTTRRKRSAPASGPRWRQSTARPRLQGPPPRGLLSPLAASAASLHRYPPSAL